MIATAPHSIDVEIGLGRTIRVSRVETEHGPTLVLAVGFGSGEDFRRPSWAGDVLALSGTEEAVDAAQRLLVPTAERS